MNEKQLLNHFKVECSNIVSAASIRGKKWLHHPNAEGSRIDTAVSIGAEAAAAAGNGTKAAAAAGIGTEVAAAAGIGTELVKKCLLENLRIEQNCKNDRKTVTQIFQC
jgi:hypothetical protein